MKYNIDFEKFSPMAKDFLEDMTPLQLYNFSRSWHSYSKKGGKYDQAVKSGYSMDSSKMGEEEYFIEYISAADAKKSGKYDIGKISDHLVEGQKKWTRKKAKGISEAYAELFAESEEEYEYLKEKSRRARTGEEESRLEELETIRSFAKDPRLVYGSKESRKQMFLDLFERSGGIIAAGGAELTAEQKAHNESLRSDLEKYIY